jgi:hypothetical protein
MPFPAPLLPTEGDALPSTFEVGGRQYPDTAILRNALPGPAFRAPALSIPAGLTRGSPQRDVTAGRAVPHLARQGDQRLLFMTG